MTKIRDDMTRLMVVRNYSPKTISSYIWAVKGLAEYFWKSPNLLLPKQVEIYLYYLISEKKLKWRTVKLAASGIKFFFHQFLGLPEQHYYIPSLRTPKELPVIWTPEEIRELFHEAPDLKIRTMIQTAYSAGLRVGELVHLKVPDIDSGHRTLWVRCGKGKKDRAALLSPTLLGILRNYWKAYKPNEWLFPGNGSSQCMSTHLFGRHFRRVRDKVNPAKRCGTHSLRHSFATHQFATGADIYTVQKLLGHKSVTSTMIYIHLSTSIILSKAESLDLLKLDTFTNNSR